MQRTSIFRLNRCGKPQRECIRDGQLESAKVYEFCIEMHAAARAAKEPWPKRKELQEATRGRFALHSQSIQMTCHEFLANVETTCELRRNGDRRANFPKRTAKYRPLMWPAQAVVVKDKYIVLPMGRGRKSLVFDKPEGFPAEFGNVKLVFDGGNYALHVPVELPDVDLKTCGVQAACDLGEIHIGALVTVEGDAVVVSGRGIRSVKRKRHMQLGQIAKKRAKCKKGSNRHRRLNFAREKASARAERQVRDLRHKGNRLVTDAAQLLGVTSLFVGDPHGVRKRDCGRKHNQRMSSWEYGQDKLYLAHKGEQSGISVSFGDERGTSSTCPNCNKRHKPKGRVFACPSCGLVCHRDVVGGVNQNRKAWDLASVPVPNVSRITYLRPGAAAVRHDATTLRIKSKGSSVSSSRPDTGHQSKTATALHAASVVAVATTKAESAGSVSPDPV
jgi:putative transposase